MSKEVVIKSNRYGIKLILDGQMSFPELLEKVGEKFRETGAFFKDAKMAVSFYGRELTVEEEQKIVDVITDNSDIQIVCVMDNDSVLEERMKERVESFGNAEQHYSTAKDTGQETQIIEAAADFYRGNLRSGQILESASSITLIGDVNPGAKIISQGNIVIIGSLKGNAHAGAGGNRNCFIFALEMRPIQLQIGDLLAKSPDKEKATKRARKGERNLVRSYVPQIVVEKDGNICIEPMTKGCLDKLESRRQ